MREVATRPSGPKREGIGPKLRSMAENLLYYGDNFDILRQYER